MAFVDEARNQLIAMLNAWDFSPAFPVGYAGTKAVIITDAWPYDLIDNMLNETNGKMTTPVISILQADASDTFRSMGGVMGAGSTPTSNLYATRVDAVWLVSVWADQQMGGADTTEKIGGLVEGCAFYNRERLVAVQHLRTRSSRGSYAQTDQMWRFDLSIEGSAIVSYYA